MSKKRKKIVIIDGNALIHRSFHALPPTMTTSSGEIVNAVFGFTSGLLRAIQDLKPEYIVVAFDKKGPTFRHEMYKEYKSTRTKAPDELYKQIPRVKEVVRAFNIPILEIERYEADDLIGTIACRVGEDLEKVVVTGDMDILQLINDTTKVYRMSRGVSDYVLFDKEMVVEKYNIRPDQVIDYKALRGDASDNIPGVRGIGEKTAVNLLSDFDNLDEVYKNIASEKITDRIRKLLIEHREDAFLSRDLATIKLDIPLDFNLDDAVLHDFNLDNIIKLFTELEFKSLLERVRELIKNNSGKQGISTESEDKFERNRNNFNYQLVDDAESFSSFLKKLKEQESFAFDVETSGTDCLLDELFGISFCWQEGEAYYVNVRGADLSNRAGGQSNLFGEQDSEKNDSFKSEILLALRPIFANDKIKKYAHNIKFDMRFIGRVMGIEVKGVDFDTMIASYLLNPGTRQNNLDAVSFAELGIEKISREDLLGKGKDKITYSDVPLERMMIYSCEDVDCTFRLVEKLRQQLQERKLEKLFQEVEMPLTSVLAQMENNGIAIDVRFLGRMSKVLHSEIKKLEEKIHQEAGQIFNIKSTKQLKEILFEKLQISTAGVGKTKTGFSTAFEELEKIKNLHPIISLVQDYRELTKLTSTYIDALPELINPRTGRIHTSFNQTIAATGRLSSTEPNLQNIPIKTDLGREIRKAFIVGTGFKLVAIDYSQIELRVAAHLSGDARMIDSFRRGVDIHTTTAAAINGIDISEVTKRMRSDAKAVNFGVLYGQGAHGLSQATGIDYKQAKMFIDQYFSVYSGVKKYLDGIIEFAHINGYVETYFGRRRQLPDINSSMPMVKKSAERMAVNTPIQGTAADLLKMAMIKTAEEIKRMPSEYNAKMLLQVHDELVFEVREEYAAEMAKQVKKIMENVAQFQVPIVAEIKIGDDWGEMK